MSGRPRTALGPTPTWTPAGHPRTALGPTPPRTPAGRPRKALAPVLILLSLALASTGCGGARHGDKGEGAAVPRGTVSKPAPSTGTAPATPGTPIPVAAGDKETPTATVRELVDSAAWVGKRVRVSGRCLGYSPTAGGGAPPLTKSDWLLGADGAFIYVNGALPPGCSSTSARETPVTIVATVAQDTLAQLGGKPGTPRRYLVIVGP